MFVQQPSWTRPCGKPSRPEKKTMIRSLLSRTCSIEGEECGAGSHRSRVKLGLNGDFTDSQHSFIKGIGCFTLLVIGIVSFSESYLEPKLHAFQPP